MGHNQCRLVLSVEEQFYVAFPLLLLGVSKLKRRVLTPVLVAVLVVSFVSAVYLTESNPILSFYATHTRAWELMAGALVAIHQQKLVGWIGQNRSLTGFCLFSPKPRS